MASGDLDQNFVKALKLLLSRSKESIEQLKLMTDEVIEQRKKEIANKIAAGGVDESLSSGFLGKSSVSKKEQHEVIKKREREVERANLEKLKQDIANLSEESSSKKLKLDPGSSPVVSASASPRSSDGKDKERDRGTKLKSESREKPRERLREIEEDIFFGLPSSSSSSNKLKDLDRSEKDERNKVKEPDSKEEKTMLSFVADSGSDTEISGDELQKDGLEDMQFELELGNLSCVVCKAFGVSSTNRLIECQECHSLYHQECHKPPVTDNVNDPRFVWYCNKCAKNLKKIVTKSTAKKVKHPLPLNARESPVGRTAKTDPVQIQQPFKRLEQPIKLSSSKDNGTSPGTSGNGRGLSGLASLAANLSKSSSSSLDSSKVSKSDANSRTAQLGSSSHSAFTSRIDTGKFAPSDSSSLKTISPKTDVSFKSSHPIKNDPGKSSAVGTQGQSKTQTGKSVTGQSAASSSSTAKMSQSSLMSADKRLQMMKKQAAKMAEKRSSLK